MVRMTNFYLLICATLLIGGYFGVDAAKPINEGQFRSGQPLLSKESFFIGSWQLSVEEGLSKNLALRSFLIRKLNEAIYLIFNSTLQKNVILGSNKSVHYLPYIKSTLDSGFTGAELEEWKIALHKLDNKLQNNKTKLIFLIVPSVEFFSRSEISTIKFPGITQRRSAALERIDSFSNIEIVDLYESFASSGGRSLFLMKDYHWNPRGAFIAGNLAYSKAALSVGTKAHLQWEDYELKEIDDPKMYVLSLMSLDQLITEKVEWPQRKSTSQQRKIKSNVWLVGDSFTLMLKPFLSSLFTVFQYDVDFNLNFGSSIQDYRYHDFIIFVLDDTKLKSFNAKQALYVLDKQ